MILSDLLTKYLLSSFWVKLLIFLIFYFIIQKLHYFDTDLLTAECMPIKKRGFRKETLGNFPYEVPVIARWDEVDEPFIKLAAEEKTSAREAQRLGELNRNSMHGQVHYANVRGHLKLHQTIENYMTQSLPLKQDHARLAFENIELQQKNTKIETALASNTKMLKQKSYIAIQKTIASYLEPNEAANALAGDYIHQQELCFEKQLKIETDKVLELKEKNENLLEELAKLKQIIINLEIEKSVQQINIPLSNNGSSTNPSTISLNFVEGSNPVINIINNTQEISKVEEQNNSWFSWCNIS